MKKRKILKILAAVNAVSGIVILTAVFWPMISYEIESRQKFAELLSPVPGSRTGLLTNQDITTSQPSDAKRKPFAALGSLDYTKASNWFLDGVPQQDFTSSNIDSYNLSIPKLGIENSSATIGGEDLSESLIHYPGTAKPGKRGNSVVFGHSILPQFYNPEDYLAVFSTLPSLEQGDEINVDYDGVSYNYEVEDMFEVSPTDIQILEQDPSDSFLTLVTCVPPGHPLRPKRLIVRARIIPPGEEGISSTTNETFRN